MIHFHPDGKITITFDSGSIDVTAVELDRLSSIWSVERTATQPELPIAEEFDELEDLPDPNSRCGDGCGCHD